MTLASHARFDLPEQQQAFVGLLAVPLVGAARHPQLHRDIARHRPTLERWCARAGYRLTALGTQYRLVREPIDGRVALPAGGRPPRRELVLALVAAAALEEIGQDSVTLQELSDAVRRTSARAGVTPYDPDERRQRVDLTRAVERLIDLGMLERRTHDEEALAAWEREGTGIGAGLVLERDALVALLDPRALHLALAGAPSDADDGDRADARGTRLLRTLLETQALFPGELSARDADYLRMQRHRLVSQANEMTGGQVEVRSDALVLVLPAEGVWSARATVPFPGATASAWVGLRLLDECGARARPVDHPGFRRCDGAVVDAAAEDVLRSTRLRRDLDTAGAVRAAAERELVEAGLLRRDGEDWLLTPAAGRYRAATLEGRAAETTLETTPASTASTASTPRDESARNESASPTLFDLSGDL